MVEEVQKITMDLVVAQLVRGLVEVASQFADVVDVSRDGLG